MQVAREFYLSREKTYSRKLAEILMAYRLESTFGKDRLLELYMNQIYLGEHAYGFAAAASIYFGKTLDQLTVAQAAMLAGLPKAPGAYNPVVNPDRATQRQRYILQRMLTLGFLGDVEYRQALAEKTEIRSAGDPAIQEAGYVVERARRLMLDQYGEQAYTMGLDVTTTIDMQTQRGAERALRQGLFDAQAGLPYAGPEARLPPDSLPGALSAWPDLLQENARPLRAALVTGGQPGHLDAVLRDGTAVHLPLETLHWSVSCIGQKACLSPGAVIRIQQQTAPDRRYLGQQRWRLAQRPSMEGALVSMDVHTGDILALVGGLDSRLNSFDHALQAWRQPGSSFKPFVWSAALERGYFPGTQVNDAPRILEAAETGAGRWQPRDYGNHYEGFITLRRGLARSKNLVAVGLMQATGAVFVQQFAQQFGFDDRRNPPSLPLALGAGAVTPLQLANAYAVFANDGLRVEPRLIATVRDRTTGTLLYQAADQPPPVRAISSRNAFIMDSLLRDVVAHGTARGAILSGRHDVAGKTGTSNQARDVWFAGYSSGLSTVVWLGYDDSRSLGNVTGARLALPVWARYMRVAVVSRPESARTQPDGIVMYDGDYAYREYTEGNCQPAQPDFIHSPFECKAVTPDASSERVDATERERILQLFRDNVPLDQDAR